MLIRIWNDSYPGESQAGAQDQAKNTRNVQTRLCSVSKQTNKQTKFTVFPKGKLPREEAPVPSPAATSPSTNTDSTRPLRKDHERNGNFGDFPGWSSV